MSPQDPAPQPAAAAGTQSGTAPVYLVTGVLRPSSVATAVARLAQRGGARVLLTAPPATARLTTAQARRLGVTEPVLSWDAADPGSGDQLREQLQARGVTRLDGVLHAVAHADASLLGSLLPGAQPLETATRARLLEQAFTVSAASLVALAEGLRSLLGPGGSLVALTFDTGHVHQGYGWMGPLKAALESAVRGLAVELGPSGVQVNAVCLGPLSTPAAQAIPGFPQLAEDWAGRAPQGWDPADPAAAARTVLALLSGALPGVTGQVLPCDGGGTLSLG